MCLGATTKRLKKVTVISTEFWLVNMHGASILNLFEVLSKLKYKVKILLPSDNDKIIEEDTFSIVGLEVKRFIPLLTILSLYTKDLKFTFTEKPDVLIFDFPMLPIFLFARLLWKCKGIMLILSRPVGESFLNWLLFRLSLIIGRLFVDIFTAISPYMAVEFSRLGKIPRNKVIVVPSPLGEEFERFNFSRNINELRSKLGLDMLLGKKILLYHGVLDERRGILHLLELFDKSFKGDDKVVLLLVGDGPAKDSIRSFIQRNKINNIVLLDPVPYSKIPELISACDVGLVLLPDHPWWRYQCPTKLIEFLALGKPVIASDLPGIRWVACDSPLVIRLGKLDQETFKEECIKVISNLKEMEVHAPKAYQETVKRFSSKAIALKLGQLIDSLGTPPDK
jgi:glycosyltransferase involved in cell wall biosynthesis